MEEQNSMGIEIAQNLFAHKLVLCLNALGHFADCARFLITCHMSLVTSNRGSDELRILPFHAKIPA
jgi:hypothetical protein